MKKILVAVLIIAASTVTAHADVIKMDGLLRIAKKSPEAGKSVLGKAVSIKENREVIECLVKSSDPDATALAIKDAGGEVRAIIGEIMTASIPSAALDSISDRKEVVYIEAARALSPKMNAARAFTRVDSVQAGTGLDKAYTGSGVLVGVVDNSIDWQHVDFNDNGGETRICYIHEKTSTGLIECSKADIDDDSCLATEGGPGYHGTHVTGIAAGSDSTYTGVAPESFVAFAFNAPSDPFSSNTGSTSFSTTVLEGVDAIFNKADSFDMPAVINLSLGTSLGAHDDTSLLEEGLNTRISGEEGRIIVNAAGNENLNSGDPDATYYGGIHAPISVSASLPTGWSFAIRDVRIASYAENGENAIVDVWLADTASCRGSTIEVKAYPANDWSAHDTSKAAISTTPLDFNSDQSDSKTNGAGTVKVSVDTFSTNAQNSRPEALIRVGPQGTGTWSNIVIPDIASPTAGYLFDVIIKVSSLSCAGDMWLYPDQTWLIDFQKNISAIDVIGTGGYKLADGDSNKTMTIPGTASGVITVGSYMGRGFWTDINGTTQHQTDPYGSPNGATGGTVDKISLFSSLGPTGETTGARKKPDIVAPGEPIISTLASAYNPSSLIKGDAKHMKLEGSSMSSPHVAGIVALMLEKNNCLTATKAKEALTSTAVPFSGQTGQDNTYGFGKVDALSAMQAIGADTSCYSGTNCGGGGGGGGGCGTSVIPVSVPTGILSILAMIAPLLILLGRRFFR